MNSNNKHRENTSGREKHQKPARETHKVIEEGIKRERKIKTDRK